MKHPDPLLLARIGLALTRALPRREGGHVVLITSTLAREGKSYVAGQLARTLAQAGEGDVALVSTSDERIPSGGTEPESAPRGSLTDLIAHGRLPEAAFAGVADRLYRVPAGTPTLHRSVFSSSGVTRAFAALRQRFALSVVDGPLMIGCGAMLPHADAVVLVVDSTRTPSQAIRREMAKAGLESSRLTGVVLNRVVPGLSAWMGGD